MNWKKCKKLGNIANVLTIIGFFVTLIGFGFAYYQYRAYTHDKKEKLENTFNYAKSEFKKGQGHYENAFNFFREYYQSDPEDSTGYNSFMKEAQKISDTLPQRKKQMLEWANQLSPVQPKK
ncbi:MAG: hypothetical protein LBT27_01710 [Prevotellaceae bacterium]|jgi:hypothetical protein|nr:hypothetical protein [Prevotellaceae bacterium]